MTEIFIKDDFFPIDEYNKIVEHMVGVDYQPPEPENRKTLGAYWFTCDLPENSLAVQASRTRIKEHFSFDIKEFVIPSCYTIVSASDKPRPHTDSNWNPKYQCLIYMKGDEKINNGTGFYKPDKDNPNNHILSTHVGFRPNRAIFFNSLIFHAPLHWAGDSEFRYSICNFFK